MGYRLSKIYTKTGDNGETSLAANIRVSKSSIFIKCLAEIDDLNSCLGLVVCHANDGKLKNILLTIQQHLFNLGAEISLPKYQKITELDIAFLEENIDFLNINLPSLKEFILPGGSAVAAFCHLARTSARKVEIIIVSLHEDVTLSDYILAYINRLSDLLFVLSRTFNNLNGNDEVYWQSERNN